MKTKEELNALRNEIKTLNAKLAELSNEELELVVGGIEYDRQKLPPERGGKNYAKDILDNVEPGQRSE